MSRQSEFEGKLTNRLAFCPTSLHRGLVNDIGENNCFLNVTIQALWHLGPFRVELKKFIFDIQNSDDPSKNSNKDGLLEAICNLFIQYEFTDQNVLPPTELRHSLGKLSDQFQLGKIADANEAFDAILDKIHSEFRDTCPQRNKCLSHLVFGGLVMEQATCQVCKGTSEPILRSDYIMCFQAAELLSYVEEEEENLSPIVEGAELINNKKQSPANAKQRHSWTSALHHLPVPKLDLHLHAFDKMNPCISDGSNIRSRSTTPTHQLQPHSASSSTHATPSKHQQSYQSKYDYSPFLFGKLLNKCLQVNQRTCPSVDENAKKNLPTCKGKANVQLHSLEPPLALALSVGWSQPTEEAKTLEIFYSLVSYTIQLSDLFSTEGTEVPDLNRYNTPRSTTSDANGNSNHNNNNHSNNSSNHNILPMDEKTTPKRTKSSSTFDGMRLNFDLWKNHKKLKKESQRGPKYVFRGLVCYYGLHYVSIFQEVNPENKQSTRFLLFDDHRVRVLGEWEDVKAECVRSRYQPVLLLYELEKPNEESDTITSGKIGNAQISLSSHNSENSLNDSSYSRNHDNIDHNNNHRNHSDEKYRSNSNDHHDRNNNYDNSSNDNKRRVTKELLEGDDFDLMDYMADDKDITITIHNNDRKNNGNNNNIDNSGGDKNHKHSDRSNNNQHLTSDLLDLDYVHVSNVDAKINSTSDNNNSSNRKSVNANSMLHGSTTNHNNHNQSSLLNPEVEQMKEYIQGNNDEMEVVNKNNNSASIHSESKHGYYWDHNDDKKPFSSATNNQQQQQQHMDDKHSSHVVTGVSANSYLVDSTNNNHTAASSELIRQLTTKTIITDWYRKPYRYQVSIPIFMISGKPSLGIEFGANEKDMMIVLNFLHHPVTHEPLLIRTQKGIDQIELMDMVRTINDKYYHFSEYERLESDLLRRYHNIQDPPSDASGSGGGSGYFANLLDRSHNHHQTNNNSNNNSDNRKCVISFESSYRKVLCYKCPSCRMETIIPNNEEEVLRMVIQQKKEKIVIDDVILKCNTCLKESVVMDISASS